MPKITLSMIVKNEEKYLRGCLDSVKGIVDEIIIIDTGSTDATLAIAEEYNANIHHFEWIKDFSAARNYALSKSTGDWILYLDADERIEKRSKKEIFSIIKGNKNLAVNCLVNSLSNNNNSSLITKYVRFFKNHKDVYFEGNAHEQIEPSLAKLNYTLVDSTIAITHLGYNTSKEALREKAKRNLEMLLVDYQEKPTSYKAYQISSTYSILYNRETAVHYAKIALTDFSLRKELRSVCYIHIADYELETGNILVAKEIIDKALGEDRSHPMLNFLASQIYHRINETDQAINYCKNSLLQNSKAKSAKNSKKTINIVIDEKKIVYQGILLSLTLDNSNELNYYLERLSNVSQKEHILFSNILNNNKLEEEDVLALVEIIDTSGLEVLLKILKENNNGEFKLDFFSNIYDRFNNNLEYLTNFGEFLISINQIQEAEIILKTTFDVSMQNYSAIFFLASIYIQTNQLNKLQELLTKADGRIGLNSNYYPQLCLLKEKVSPLLTVREI